MRVIIATEAKHAGIPIEEAVKLFSHLPDYNEEISRTKLEEIYDRSYGRYRCATILEKSGSIILTHCQKCCSPWASENVAKYRGHSSGVTA